MVLALLWTGLAGPSVAQQAFWVQIEAVPTLAQAEERARSYATRLDAVSGYRLASGWYAIALGPYQRPDAESLLVQLRAGAQIPRDSFLADGGQFRQQFWPAAGASGAIRLLTPPDNAPSASAEAAAAPLRPAEETPAQARASERLLTRDEREEIQRALQAEGYYAAAIDGAFGPGTRRAMAAWQTANGYEATGVLSTAQRNDLLAAFRELLARLGMAPLVDVRAGIEMLAPMGLVAFDGYEAPFARYTARDGSGVQLLLISQAGDRFTLAGLYDVLQTLEIVPFEGDRNLGARSFSIFGANSTIETEAYAELNEDTVKGFVLVWPAGDAQARRLAVSEMRASFSTMPDTVLPDSAGGNAVQGEDLLAGLQIRQPEFSGTGFFVDADGTVLTAAAGLRRCERITLNGETTGTLSAVDEASGLALVNPAAPTVPIAYARFSDEDPRLRSEIAVAGYSWGGSLSSPTLTFGNLADLRGLNGEAGVKRLALAALPGDAGGPVLDTTGAVVGMLLPRPSEGGRILPDDVSFAAGRETIAAFLAANGIGTEGVPEGSTSLAPEDLSDAAANMTVLVECWN